jgi:hypothetical protein
VQMHTFLRSSSRLMVSVLAMACPCTGTCMHIHCIADQSRAAEPLHICYNRNIRQLTLHKQPPKAAMQGHSMSAAECCSNHDRTATGAAAPEAGRDHTALPPCPPCPPCRSLPLFDPVFPLGCAFRRMLPGLPPAGDPDGNVDAFIGRGFTRMFLAGCRGRPPCPRPPCPRRP